MNDLLSKNTNAHFSKELPADKSEQLSSRQVHEACFSFTETTIPANPELVHLSTELMKDLDIKIEDKEAFTKMASGAIPFKDFRPYAMCYGGHQFGNWAGQLGDGRATNIAEIDLNGKNWKFQLKGAGPTPYSRGSDGLAVLRSSVREYLCSEAMHSLGVPTTRALSLVKTGDLVTRDMLYDGNPEEEQGAIVCRVSPSFLRFGSFEIFNARQDITNLKVLVDYTINHHYHHLGAPSKETYVNFFKEVVTKTKDMIVHWQRVGFVHGVMNTDNMSILGLTIDYGPYGWLEDFNPGWTPNTTDRQNKRYRFGNQPSVALWNLTQLANALYPLIEEVEPLQDLLEGYKVGYLNDYHTMMSEKLGLFNSNEVSDVFFAKLEENLTRSEIDYTIFFRELSDRKYQGFSNFWKTLVKSSYLELTELQRQKENWEDWFTHYADYLAIENANEAEREEKMRAVNPKYVLRNYMAQLAIDEAEKGEYKLVNELYQLLLNPYEEQPAMQRWYAKRPEWAKHKVGCSMLSCSS
ncbi:MAG: protein adenylyltransferase SelO [Flavobacteriales bacterium]